MGSSGVDQVGYKKQAISDWANSVVDALDTAYDDIDTLEALVDALVSEGDYSTYTKQITLDAPVVARYALGAIAWTDSSTKAMVRDSTGNLLIIDCVAETITDTTKGVHWIRGGTNIPYGDYSIYGKYVLWTDEGTQYLYLYKDGSLIQTEDYKAADNNDYLRGASISPDGKYFIVCWRDNSESKYKYDIWLGS